MTASIPFFDAAGLHAPILNELETAVRNVITSGQYIMGPEVRAFEEEAAKYLGVPHAVSVNSGTDALVLALDAAGVGPGDEVIVPSWTFFATSEAVLQVGAIPVFADIDIASFNLSAESVLSAITAKTKAVIVVHLYGRALVLDGLLDELNERNIVLVEDTAQAFGANYGYGEHAQRKAGTLGIGAYSFFPTKNLGCCGDGGLLVCQDDDLATKVRALRTHGGLVKYQNEMAGYNSRLDAMQAAILRVKLPHTDNWNEARRTAASNYNNLLGGLGLKLPEVSDGHVFHQYTMLLPEGTDRAKLQDALKAQGIPTMVYYPVPNHKLPVFDTHEHIRIGKLPNTTEAASRALSLPMSPVLQANDQETIATAIRALLKS